MTTREEAPKALKTIVEWFKQDYAVHTFGLLKTYALVPKLLDYLYDDIGKHESVQRPTKQTVLSPHKLSAADNSGKTKAKVMKKRPKYDETFVKTVAHVVVQCTHAGSKEDPNHDARKDDTEHLVSAFIHYKAVSLILEAIEQGISSVDHDAVPHSSNHSDGASVGSAGRLPKSTGLLNFQTKEGQSLYRAAVEKSPSHFSVKNPNGPINVLENPHLVTLKQAQKHVGRFASTETRPRQNDAMLFGCLVSLFDDHTLTMMSSMKAHEFRNHEDPFSGPHESGVTYFKLLLDRAEYNSQAVVANLQVEISQLHLVIGSMFSPAREVPTPEIDFSVL
ncbi:hypothetical protein IV203_019187 [Nitzschia inconspicua]|uniref:Uncharacterized protein n=1 Tax=Nitzschia inconspicua TaxID=303405 RepID=A0A9K3Q425_9STRA|nr:hypothetical protein IV203_019187 [Nitzschia inconspicua]